MIRRTALRWPAVTPARAVFLARRAARIAAGAALVVLGVGGIPGARGRAATRPWADDATPRVPSDLGDRDGRLEVTVTTLEGAPVAAAHVRALSMVDDHAYLADASDTDAGGAAHLAHLPRGAAWILVDAAGRARGATRLAIEPADGPRSIALALGPEHVLDVVVNDELGAAVAGASIEVTSPVAAGADPLPVGARAGADGHVRVGRLGPGPWRATASAPGFEDAGGSGREGTALALTLRKLGAIAAHVVGQDATPAAGARVAVAGAMLWPARVAVADARGDVRIGGLPAGTYALRATKDDAVSPIELDVSLGRGEEKQVVLRLGRGRFVGVVVTDGDARDAAPIASARVTLAEGGLSPFPLEATTDRAGRARLGPIAPGTAALGARADGYMPRGAVAVPDPPPAETRVALVRAGTVTGRVLDARGRPIDGATIAIVGTDAVGQPIFDDPRRAGFQAAHFEAMLAGPAPLLPGGELGVIPGPVPPIPNGTFAPPAVASTGAPALGASTGTPSLATMAADPWVTRSDGTFGASPASPGRVRVIVRHPQYVEAQSDLVTLAPGGEARVDVVMREGGALDGRVLDSHERPVARARVVVTAARGDLERATRTASDGTFAFAALPEDVIVTASASDDGQPDARLAVAVPEGGRREVTLVLPEPREALPVSIVDDRGYPVDAAQLSATSLSPGAWLRSTAFSDAHGEASLPRGRGIALRVEVRAPSRAPRVVTTDGTEERLRVELTRAERAAGEVVAERGRDAIAGASITLYTDLGARRVQTDAQGAFAVTELAPGGARLSVRAPGFAPWTKPVTIPDSGGRRVFAIPRVELAAEGAIEGDVVDARGEPVAGARVARDSVPTWLLVGSNPADIAITDTTGHFTLRELPEGTITVEAYAVGVGRARVGGVRVVGGRTTDGVRVAIGPADDDAVPAEVSASGSVAVTLGETDAPVAAIVVSVVEGSEAERAGLVPGDVLLTVDGARVGGMADARAKLSGPIGDDVVVEVRRGDGTLALRVPREAVRR